MSEGSQHEDGMAADGVAADRDSAAGGSEADVRSELQDPQGLLSDEQLRARRAASSARRARDRRRRRLLPLAAIATAAAVTLVLVLVVNARSPAHRRVAARTPAGNGVTSSGVAGATTPGQAVTTMTPRAKPLLRHGDAAVVQKLLAGTSYIRLGARRQRDIALTFDDGPGPYTAGVLRVLERMHAHATFFVIGTQVAARPGLVAAEARAHDEVGDHTETHPDLAKLAPADQREQVLAAAQTIVDAGAPRPVLLRPPYGDFDDATLRLLHTQDMLMVLWSVDTNDYQLPGVRAIVSVALAGARPGAIILMHDGGGDRSETIAALPRIIKRLRARGYHLVTVARLAGEDPPPADQPPPPHL